MEALMEYLKTQTEVLVDLSKKLQEMRIENGLNVGGSTQTSIPWPNPMNTEEGDDRDNYEEFITGWENYCNATGITTWNDLQKSGMLLKAIGTAATKKYDLEFSKDEKMNTKAVTEKIQKVIYGKANVTMDRYKFFTTKQQIGESFNDFYHKLKNLAKRCNFDIMKDQLVCHQIIMGVTNDTSRKKLLGIPKIYEDLTQAVQICETAELTSENLKEITSNETVNHVNKIKKVSADKKKGKRKCKFCGLWHVFEKGICTAFGKTCVICNGKNHTAKVCKKKKVYEQKKAKHVNEINRSNTRAYCEDDDSVVIAKIKEENNPNNVFAELNLKFNKKFTKTKCMLDTGSNTCLIGYDQYKILMEGDESKITVSQQVLSDFNGNPIQSVGEIRIPCILRDKHYILIFQVVKKNHGPLLSANACFALGLLTASEEVIRTPRVIRYPQVIEKIIKWNSIDKLREEAHKITTEFNDVFNGYGELPGEVELEIDDSVTPRIQAPRRIPNAYRNQLKEELQKLENDGIITKIERHTDWVSNLVLVKRNTTPQSFRMCLDPVLLNTALKRPNYQFTTLDEILPELGKAKIFSTCDTAKGFWQLKLSKASSDLTCFWTPFGRYAWLRMPFGICSAPEIFQMKIKEIVHGLRGIEVLADDILIYGSGNTLEEAYRDHNQNYRNLMIRLRKQNVKLNRQKLNLCQTSVRFYGHILTSNGIKADESKIQAIKNIKVPSNKQDLKQFIGMVTYLSRYIQNLSTEISKLRKLSLDKTEWKWTAEEETEFNKIKDIVCKVQPLKYFDPAKPVIIECDSSSYGLGAVLIQEKNVVAYASRTLTATEKNYAQIEKELLAVVFACVRFDQMIFGHKVLIRTDHKPLINIFMKPLLKAPRRLQLMLMILQRYNLEFEYIQGKNNVIADTLSRAIYNSTENCEKELLAKSDVCVITAENEIYKFIEKVNVIPSLKITDERLKNIKEETRKDESCQRLINIIQTGWPNYIREVPDDVKIFYKFKNELSTHEGFILHGNRILIPYTLRPLLLKKLHISHSGIEAALRLARQNIFWPGMNSSIRQAVQNCEICAKFARSQQKPPMLTNVIPEYPFQLVSMDVFVTMYKGKQEKFLITVDHYSDFFEVDILKDMTPKTTIEICKKNFSRFGIPQKILTDNGTNFINDQFNNFARNWEFMHTTSAPHHQQTNGKAEATVKIAKRLIQKTNESGEDLWYALLNLRNTPNKIDSSPAQRLLARKTRSSVPTATEELKLRIISDVPEKIKKSRQRAKFYYDRKSRELPTLKVGQPVMVQLQPEKSKVWINGYVKKRCNDRSYLVNVNGVPYRRDLVNIKPRRLGETENESIGDERSTKNTSEEDSEVGSSIRNNLSDRVPRNNQEDTITYPPYTDSQDKAVTNAPPATTHTARPRREIRLPERFKDFVIEKN